MKKNVASQIIGAQMVSATDGSAFTGTATVVITVDGGTQSASGGTGPTHEGNGFHSYIPTQAETNGDHVAFTFTGSGAVPVTVQVYPTFPQTGDNFALIGTAGAGLTNINLPDQTMDITGNITGNLSGSVGSVTGAVGSVTGAVGSVTGNVGGNVTGSVGSVSGVTFPTNFGDLAITVTTGQVTVGTNNDKTGYSISGTKTTLDALNDIAATAIVSGGAITTSGGAVSNVTLVATTTTNSDMRGTDSALLASSAPTNFGDLAITVTTGQVTVGTNNDKTGYSISGTKTTLDALNDIAATAIVSGGAITTSGGAVSNVTLVATTTTNSDMRGTDSAFLAASAPTNFSALGISVGGAIDNVTLTATTTTNSDMRGTDSALLASSAPTNFGDLAITVTTGQVTVGTNNDKTGYSISGTKTTLDALNDIAATSIVSGGAITTSGGAVSNVTLVATTTTNSDMVAAAPTATANAEALLKIDLSTVTGEAARSVLNAMRFLRNRWVVSGGTLTVYKEDDSTSAWTGTVSTDAAAEPVTGNDPA